MRRSHYLWVLCLSCALFACGDDTSLDSDGGTSGTGVDTTSTSQSTTEDGTTVNISVSASDTDSDGSTGDSGPRCGDGMLNVDGEECDVDVFGGVTCEDEGFDGGTPICTDQCLIDLSGCSTCGDMAVEGDEDCEGDVGDDTCESIDMGFVGGTLACDDDCSFDTSSCDACGNGVIDSPEECDGTEVGTTCADLGMGFTGGTLACLTGCTYDTNECTNLPNPVAAGELIITEVMQNPATLADEDGEYFEVYNPSVDTTYQLQGCVVEGNQSDAGFTIDADLPAAPGEYVVFSVETAVAQGFTPDWQWDGAEFGLNNTSDRVALVCDATVIDEVSYDNGATFPDPNGVSMNLAPGYIDAGFNDFGSRWCPATTSFNGDLGTPGDANDTCDSIVSYTIDFCRLQFPVAIDDVTGNLVDVFGRIFIAGLTDQSGTNDLAPEVIGYVGYGPDGTDPALDAGWTWTQGTDNTAYGPASPGYEANNDEYEASLTIPAGGEYDFAFRFSADGGFTFAYCDGGAAGSSDGYAAGDAGQMTAHPPELYFSEYLEGTGNDKALELYNASVTDSVDLDLCDVLIYFNGGNAVGATIPLTGMLAPDSVYVVCDDGISDATFCDQLQGGNFYNGDDAIELACSSVPLDVIGQIGNDPGAEWNVGGIGTMDEVLRRDCSVTVGDADGSNAFDPSAEWNTFAQDDFTDFGQYPCP